MEALEGIRNNMVDDERKNEEALGTTSDGMVDDQNDLDDDEYPNE